MLIHDNEFKINPDFLRAWLIFGKEISLVFQAAKSEEKSRPLAARQVRYVLACLALNKFLLKVGEVEAASQFHGLGEAIQDLVDGIPSPLFKVEKPPSGGRRPDPSGVWRVRANICVALEILEAAGFSSEKSIPAMARKHRTTFSKLLRPGATLESSMSAWQKSFAGDAVNNAVALGIYRHGIRRLSEEKMKRSGQQLRELGEQFVELALANVEKIP